MDEEHYPFFQPISEDTIIVYEEACFIVSIVIWIYCKKIHMLEINKYNI